MNEQFELPLAANDNNFWAGCDLECLPKTALEARSIGSRYFFTGAPCTAGHVSPKYTKGGRCVDCAMIHTASGRSANYKGAGAVARAAIKRTVAAAKLQDKYVPDRPCKHGHMLRWVSSNNCVECDGIARIRVKERTKERRIENLYGLDFEQLEALKASQGRKCAICDGSFDDGAIMHIDHCHDAGHVRGLLCSRCNQAIGLLQDNPDIIRAAADYVEKHKDKKAA